jgi:uncharacterized membrane protein SirB2
MPYPALLHSHVSTWAIALILFFIAYYFLSTGKQKALKITHMTLRLFFILVIVTGVGLLHSLNYPTYYIIKGLLAFFLFFTMEMILVRGRKGLLTGSRKFIYWNQLIVLLILVLLLGYEFF